MCSCFMFLSFNTIEPVFSIRSSSFLCLYHSGECSEVFEINLFFLSVVLLFGRMLSSFSNRYFLSVLVCKVFLAFFLIVFDDRRERMDKVMICEDFEDSSYNAKNGGKWVIFWRNTYSLKIIYRNHIVRP